MDQERKAQNDKNIRDRVKEEKEDEMREREEEEKPRRGVKRSGGEKLG